MKNRLLATLITVALPLAAVARTDDNRGAWADWQEIGALTNCSAASINAAVVCGDTFGVKVEGYNVMTLEILYTRSAGTGWQFYLETCYEGHTTSDCTAAGDWHVVTSQRVVVGTGVTISPDPFIRVVSATDRVTYTIPINYRRVRLNGFVATGSPDANDKITVNARIGIMPAM
jgi:hypothetical protein